MNSKANKYRGRSVQIIADTFYEFTEVRTPKTVAPFQSNFMLDLANLNPTTS